MPATTIHRVVRNTSVAAGGLYYFERDGSLLRPLPNSGLKLKPDATNGVWIYRVASASGVPLAMTGPATLSVYFKDPDVPTAQTLINEYIAATFDAADKCFKFDLSATDFAAHNGKELAYRFKDTSVASVEASLESVLLYEQRAGYAVAERVGTWRILSATVTGLSNRAVRFESTDPSVCRVERGELASAYLKLAGEQAQSDQYCVIVGVGSGTCEVHCIAEADENEKDVVAVTVQVHPDDDPLPKVSGSALAAELAALLDHVRIPVTLLAADNNRRYVAPEPLILFERRFRVPAGERDGDTFDVSLNFAGTIPRNNARFFPAIVPNPSFGTGVFLIIGLAEGACLGATDISTRVRASTDTDLDMVLDGVMSALGLTSGAVLNGALATLAGATTEAQDKDIAFTVQAGDEIVVAWVIASHNGGEALDDNSGIFQDLPAGQYHSLMTVTSITHHGPNQAP